MSQTRLSKPRFENWRFLVIYLAAALVFIYYGIRLFSLQIVMGEKYVADANNNRTIVVNTPAQRGSILDRNGFILARNVPSYHVVITPALLPDDEDSPGQLQKIYRELSELIGTPVNKGDTSEKTVKNFTPCISDLGIMETVYIGMTNWPYSPIKIKCNVDRRVALAVQERAPDWPGVGITIEAVREYPTGNLTAEIIGFLGPIPENSLKYYTDRSFVSGRDKVGFAGIEYSMQDELGGVNGKTVMERDGAGQQLRNLEAPVTPIPGDDVILTIDTRLQTIAREALLAQIKKYNDNAGKIKSNSGVVIAMNPKTGEILALVSYPNYENNRMAREIPGYYYNQLSQDPTHPMLNHAISIQQPPGSVFKMSTAIGALNEGVVTPEYEVEDPGQIVLMEKYYENDPGRPYEYVCWDRAGHGWVNFWWGVAQSCDVYFYKIGGGFISENGVGDVKDGGLGIWRLSDYAKALGYGHILGIELPGEIKGTIPNPTWKRINHYENWTTGDTYIASMGQGYVSTTVLQVLSSFSTLANGGKVMRPTLIREVRSQNGEIVKPFAPEVLWDITVDPQINVYDGNNVTGEMKTVAPWVIETAQDAMRMVVTDGTAKDTFEGSTVESAGKTGTAEYCDDTARELDICKRGSWPTHAWYAGYAPYDNPEIVVVAFVYNGGEGSVVAGPVVRKVMEGYFELKDTTITTAP